MRIEILEQAVSDLIQGFHFYEEQEPGLGSDFLTTLYADIESLQIYAGIHRKACRNYHRLLSRRFPFSVFYTVQDQTVRIRAVVDCRRNPAWIRRHLS